MVSNKVSMNFNT